VVGGAVSATYGAVTVSVTHLLWADRWIEACRVHDPEVGMCWRFKNGRDAADWLAWPPPPESEEGGE
jgi:hypothetical protein